MSYKSALKKLDKGIDSFLTYDVGKILTPGNLVKSLAVGSMLYASSLFPGTIKTANAQTSISDSVSNVVADLVNPNIKEGRWQSTKTGNVYEFKDLNNNGKADKGEWDQLDRDGKVTEGDLVYLLNENNFSGDRARFTYLGNDGNHEPKKVDPNIIHLQGTIGPNKVKTTRTYWGAGKEKQIEIDYSNFLNQRDNPEYTPRWVTNLLLKTDAYAWRDMNENNVADVVEDEVNRFHLAQFTIKQGETLADLQNILHNKVKEAYLGDETSTDTNIEKVDNILKGIAKDPRVGSFDKVQPEWLTFTHQDLSEIFSYRTSSPAELAPHAKTLLEAKVAGEFAEHQGDIERMYLALGKLREEILSNAEKGRSLEDLSKLYTVERMTDIIEGAVLRDNGKTAIDTDRERDRLNFELEANMLPYLKGQKDSIPSFGPNAPKVNGKEYVPMAAIPNAADRGRVWISPIEKGARAEIRVKLSGYDLNKVEGAKGTLDLKNPLKKYVNVPVEYLGVHEGDAVFRTVDPIAENTFSTNRGVRARFRAELDPNAAVENDMVNVRYSARLRAGNYSDDARHALFGRAGELDRNNLPAGARTAQSARGIATGYERALESIVDGAQRVDNIGRPLYINEEGNLTTEKTENPLRHTGIWRSGFVEPAKKAFGKNNRDKKKDNAGKRVLNTVFLPLNVAGGVIGGTTTAVANTVAGTYQVGETLANASPLANLQPVQEGIIFAGDNVHMGINYTQRVVPGGEASGSVHGDIPTLATTKDKTERVEALPVVGHVAKEPKGHKESPERELHTTEEILEEIGAVAADISLSALINDLLKSDGGEGTARQAPRGGDSSLPPGGTGGTGAGP